MDLAPEFKIPATCPVCSSQLEDEGSFLYCRSPNCASKARGSVKVWIERLGLLNWGDSLVDALTNPNDPKVATVADLYRLSIEDIALCSSGFKMAQKCYDVLHSNKTIKLELLLSAMNVPNFGIATAIDIVQSGADSLEKVLTLTVEDLERVPNIGKTTARAIHAGIQSKAEVMRDLSSLLTVSSGAGPLAGKSFCITGSTRTPRRVLQKAILDSGGIVKESVGAGLSYLITNEDLTTFTSEKAKKAQKHGVKVISESDFLKMTHTL